MEVGMQEAVSIKTNAPTLLGTEGTSACDRSISGGELECDRNHESSTFD
jgi:hypothetical protein